MLQSNGVRFYYKISLQVFNKISCNLIEKLDRGTILLKIKLLFTFKATVRLKNMLISHKSENQPFFMSMYNIFKNKYCCSQIP